MTLPDGMVAAITGGAAGIGLATAHAFASNGFDLTLIDLDRDALTDAVGQLQRSYPQRRVVGQAADVADEQALRKAFGTAREQVGPPRVLVNNVGINGGFDPVRMTAAQWELFFNIDLRSAWIATREILSGSASTLRSVVNVSSIHAALTLPGTFPYPVAKTALLGLTRSLAVELGRHGIRVNAVCPGWVGTERVSRHLADPAQRAAVDALHPLGRMVTPAQVASAILFLGTDQSEGITGVALPVDAGHGIRLGGDG